jgi:hypothetical protein
MQLKGKQFPFSEDGEQKETSRLAFLPLSLILGDQNIAASGLVDTGATVNVLPFETGTELGASWNTPSPSIQLTGNLANYEAKALILTAKIDQFEPVRLAFAWTRARGVPLILGQVNFFMEFDVCFFRSDLMFEIQPSQKV